MIHIKCIVHKFNNSKSIYYVIRITKSLDALLQKLCESRDMKFDTIKVHL